MLLPQLMLQVPSSEVQLTAPTQASSLSQRIAQLSVEVQVTVLAQVSSAPQSMLHKPSSALQSTHRCKRRPRCRSVAVAIDRVAGHVAVAAVEPAGDVAIGGIAVGHAAEDVAVAAVVVAGQVQVSALQFRPAAQEPSPRQSMSQVRHRASRRRPRPARSCRTRCTERRSAAVVVAVDGSGAGAVAVAEQSALSAPRSMGRAAVDTAAVDVAVAAVAALDQRRCRSGCPAQLTLTSRWR